jgi:uncharacterized membrane protein
VGDARSWHSAGRSAIVFAAGRRCAARKPVATSVVTGGEMTPWMLLIDRSERGPIRGPPGKRPPAGSEAMAVVVGAGTSPANEQAEGAGRAPQFEIRKIEVADVIDCIAKGVQDFGRAPGYGLFFGAVYAIGGLVIVWTAYALDYPYLAYPFVMGFALFAPFGAAGTYEISRRLESGEPLSWAAILGAVWDRSGKELGWLALVSLFTLIIWLDLAVFVFLAFYGADIPSFRQLFVDIFTTPYGIAFLLVGNGLGAIIALGVFSITAFAPPLVVDRDADFVTAMITSVRAVLANPRPMLAWAIVIGADLAIAFVTLFIALLVIFPVLGHTTWHLYRRVIA